MSNSATGSPASRQSAGALVSWCRGPSVRSASRRRCRYSAMASPRVNAVSVVLHAATGSMSRVDPQNLAPIGGGSLLNSLAASPWQIEWNMKAISTAGRCGMPGTSRSRWTRSPNAAVARCSSGLTSGLLKICSLGCANVIRKRAPRSTQPSTRTRHTRRVWRSRSHRRRRARRLRLVHLAPAVARLRRGAPRGWPGHASPDVP